MKAIRLGQIFLHSISIYYLWQMWILLNVWNSECAIHKLHCCPPPPKWMEMDRLNSGELNTCLANWELNLKLHCYVHKGVLLVPILSQLNPQNLCLLDCGSMYPLPGVFGGTCFVYIQGRRTLEMDAIGFSNTLVMNARLDITSQKTVIWPF